MLERMTEIWRTAPSRSLLLGCCILLMAIMIGCGSSEEPTSAPQQPAQPAPAAPAQRAVSAPDASQAVPQQPRQPAPAPAASQAQQVAAAMQSAQQSRAAPAPAASQAQRAAPAPAAAMQSAQQSGGAPPPVARRRPGPNRPTNTASPSATTFEDYRRSRFVWAENDAISTFSLDTDRTSYHLALNWARSGYEVDPDSVRAEEWINSFNYNYDAPRNYDSFGITTGAIDHPLYDRTYLVRLGFQAPELSDDTPLNVTLVLDASGSMADGDRISIAREAAHSITRSLGRDDRIAVVQFRTEVLNEYTVEHTTPGDRNVARSIGDLTPGRSTNVQAGLDAGVRLAYDIRRQRPDAYNYIILMSDGVANVDATNPFAILETASDRDSGNPLRLITIGVGISNYNDALLEQLAQYGNGWYRYLSTVDQARATFSRENWLALSVPFADQTRAQVTWDPEMVLTWRLIGYENRITSDQSFTENRKEFAEIPVGTATTVFYEVELTDAGERESARMLQLGDVEIRWVTPRENMSNRQDGKILADIGGRQDPLMRFGAVVALASDRYSSLPRLHHDEAGYVRYELETLRDELRDLNSDLGNLDAYRDFSFLLGNLTGSVPAPEPKRPSGYSP